MSEELTFEEIDRLTDAIHPGGNRLSHDERSDLVLSVVREIVARVTAGHTCDATSTSLALPPPEKGGTYLGPCTLRVGHDGPMHIDSHGWSWRSSTCDASLIHPDPFPGERDMLVGPCVLRLGHDGPVHQDREGRRWATRPMTKCVCTCHQEKG